MKKILIPFREAIIKYCKSNGLSYEKILQSPMCGNDTIIFIQRNDLSRAQKGLLDETPAELLLQVEKKNGGFVFTAGTNMREYLS